MSECIDRLISLYNSYLSFDALLRITVFHAQDAIESTLVDVAKDISVIDLPGRWLVPARIISDLKIGDLIPATFDVGDQISFLYLLVVDIEQDLA